MSDIATKVVGILHAIDRDRDETYRLIRTELAPLALRPDFPKQWIGIFSQLMIDIMWALEKGGWEHFNKTLNAWIEECGKYKESDDPLRRIVTAPRKFVDKGDGVGYWVAYVPLREGE